jgi:Na+-driven multidrug efflux pump
MYAENCYRCCYYLLDFPKNYLVNNIFRPLPPFAVDYLRVCVYGAVFWIYGLAGNMIIRAEGRKTAAVRMGSGLAVNALANYILMGPLHLGVAGAAWGTNIAMAAYAVLGGLYFGRGPASFKTKVFALYADKETSGSIVKLGLPVLIMRMMTILQGMVVFNTLSPLSLQPLTLRFSA